jgi:hypothetical protein
VADSALEEVSAVRDGAAGTESSGDMDSFGKFLLGYTGLDRLLSMYLDAIGTLGGERHGDRRPLEGLLAWTQWRQAKADD